MKISDENLHGRVVLTGDGLAIGEVSKLYLDENLRVASLEVRLRKPIAERLGIKRSTFHSATIEVPAAMVQSVGDVVLLSAPLAEIPGAQRARDPAQTPAPPAGEPPGDTARVH